MTSTSPGWLAPATICSQKASIEPPANTVGESGTVPRPCPMPPTTGSWASSTPRSCRASLSQRPAVVEPAEGGGRGLVHCRHAGEGVGGRGLAVPVAPGPGSLADGPGQHAPALIPLGRLAVGLRAGRIVGRPGVPVEQAGEEWRAPTVHGGDRGDHRGDHHAGGRVRRGPRSPRRRRAGGPDARPAPRRVPGARLPEYPPCGPPGCGPPPCPRRPPPRPSPRWCPRPPRRCSSASRGRLIRPDNLVMRRHYVREPAHRAVPTPFPAGSSSKEPAPPCPLNDRGHW